MALSKKDIEIIRTIIKESNNDQSREFKTDLNDLRNELRTDMKFLKTEILKEVQVMLNALKIYMNVEFKKIDYRFERLEETVGYHDAQLKEMKRN